jgi:thiol:disulfide interchange protein DsbC
MYSKALQATQEYSMSRMTTNFFRFVALLASTAVFTSALAAGDSAELEQVREKISGMFQTIEPESITNSQVDGWYTIQQGSIIAYVSGDGRYLLQGDLIDLDNSVNLSEQSRTDARRELMSTVSDNDVITFSPAEVKYSVSVFTDVECTYCRRLHSQINEYMAHGIEVRYLMYPRNGPASRAWSTAEDVWCAADRQNALTMAKSDQKFDTATCDSSMVQDHYVIGRDVGLSGTPAIVLDDGTLISGYVPPDQLAAQLEQSAAQ